jgi:hypothetical protein
MTGVSSTQIKESREELQALLKQSKNEKDKERLQVLYLLKAKRLKVKEVAEILGKHTRYDTQMARKI